MTTTFLIQDLREQEGDEKFPYKDSRGNWSIGTGHLMTGTMLENLAHYQQVGLTQSEDDNLLESDVLKTKGQLDLDIPWWRQLDDVRQDVMVALGFNLGVGKFTTWRHTLADIQSGNFSAAEVDLENDEPWASQVHGRAIKLALQLETGKRQYA